MLLTIACPCDTVFQAYPSQHRQYCSVACANVALRSAAPKTYPERNGQREHVRVAERALGHALPPGAEVHHVDRDKTNNTNHNLVICQDHGYHRLLHRRARILHAGGNPNTQRICTSCKELVALADRPRVYGKRCVCRPCFNAYRRRLRASRRAAV